MHQINSRSGNFQQMLHSSTEGLAIRSDSPESELRFEGFQDLHTPEQQTNDLSRQASQTMDWTLPQIIFNNLKAQWGSLEIDLRATAENTKLPSVLSPNPDPRAVGCNALTWDWNQWSQIYIFPPKWLIPPIMTKLQTYRHHGLIILPRYTAEIWYSYIHNRALAQWELELSDPMRNGRPALERWTAFSF